MVLHRPKAAVKQYRDLRRGYGDRNDDDQRNRGEPRKQAPQDKKTAQDFHGAHEGSQNLGRRDADLCEASGAPIGGKQEFLYPLEAENGARQETYQDIDGSL